MPIRIALCPLPSSKIVVSFPLVAMDIFKDQVLTGRFFPNKVVLICILVQRNIGMSVYQSVH